MSLGLPPKAISIHALLTEGDVVYIVIIAA